MVAVWIKVNALSYTLLLGMLWEQSCLLVLHCSGSAMVAVDELMDCCLHQYSLLESKNQGTALVFYLLYVGTWSLMPIIHTVVHLGLLYVTQHFKTESDNSMYSAQL